MEVQQLKSSTSAKLIPVLFGFFVMGFVDVVGVSTSYVKLDFALSDTLANLLPMIVFVWFAIFSMPVGILMGKIGRKTMVLLSLGVTFASMILPLIHYSFAMILLTFALLGVGNTILQVALNPLLMDVVQKEKATSTLALGYFIKAISSTLGPVLAGAAAGFFGNWYLIFPVYAAVTLLSYTWLFFTKIGKEELVAQTSQMSLFDLFKQPGMFMAFTAILLVVGFEISLMTAVPKYLLERCGIPIEQGGLGCSLYFVARTLGAFLGAILLSRVSVKMFFIVNMFAGIICFVFFMLTASTYVIFVSLFLVGLFCANVFPIVFSVAIQSDAIRANEISALMIMGVAGGALLPMVMGVVADATNQLVSLLIPLLALIYILFVSFKLHAKFSKKIE
ncbi:MAG: MFS transporter [Lachnospiraceae bacterium]|nr:MFS transporter [Lachnospiraceae bacterium]